MALTKEERGELIKKYQTHERDTSSPQVQVAVLTERLTYLNEHFKKNAKDNHSRRGLMKLVGRRRRLLDYLKSRDQQAYRTLVSQLGLRR